jgi:hypothetical protein
MPVIPKETMLNVEMKYYSNQYRAARMKRLAERVLQIVNVDDSMVLNSKLYEHADELKAKLMGPAYTYTLSHERLPLYSIKSTPSKGIHPGVKLAEFVLEYSGFIVEMTSDGEYFHRRPKP